MTRTGWLLPVALGAAQLAVWPGVPLLRGVPVAPAAVAAVVAITAVVTAALAGRRSRPVTTAVVTGVVGIAGAFALPGDEPVVIGIADLIALYSVAVHRSGRTAAATAAGLVTGQLALAVARPEADGLPLPVSAVLIAGTYTLVTAMGRRRARWHGERAAAAERFAAAEARRAGAAGAERLRLARELHDVTAHHLTSIVVAVSAAQRLAGKRPEMVAEATGHAARTGRETLDALRRLVAIMQSPPVPGLPELVASFRAAGLDVTLDAAPPGTAPPVPEAVPGIVREALTNALRYAPGSAVRVVVAGTPAGLELTVEDDGPAAPAPAGGRAPRADGAQPGLGGGNGITGMRERAAADGGELTAGPRDEGGWRVHAVFRPAGPAGTVRPARPWSAYLIDAALIAFALAGPAVAMAGVLSVPPGPAPGVAALMIVAAAVHAAPLAARRRSPWTVFAAVAVTAWCWPLLIGAGLLPPATRDVAMVVAVADLLALHAVARYGHRPALDWVALPAGIANAAAATATVFVLVPPPEVGDQAGWFTLAVTFGLLAALALPVPAAAAWTAGFVVRRRRERIAARERGAVAWSAHSAQVVAAAERARVADGLSAAVLRDTELMIAAADRGDVDGVLGAARAALDAMRGLLQGLRAPDEATRAPQPTLAAVPDLAGRWREHGRRVELRVDDPPRALPADAEISVYRVAELLLAGDTGPVELRIAVSPGEITVTVLPPPPDPDGEIAAGLRARAAPTGGAVDRSDDRLTVRLPVPATEEVASSPSV